VVTVVGEGSGTCLGCAGAVSGVIGHADERLTAEERLRDEERARAGE
jgi:hypothetical protein